jgi:hypothetical protein
MNGIQPLTALASATAALVFAAPITASPPAPAAGTVTPTSAVVTSVRTADGNTHMEIVGTGVLAGTVSGTVVLERHLVIHPDGHANVNDYTVFTGATPCGAGTFTTQFVGTIDANGNLTGRVTTIRDDSNTANFHANLAVVGGPAGIAYSGGYHCH